MDLLLVRTKCLDDIAQNDLINRTLMRFKFSQLYDVQQNLKV